MYDHNHKDITRVETLIKAKIQDLQTNETQNPFQGHESCKTHNICKRYRMSHKKRKKNWRVEFLSWILHRYFKTMKVGV